MLLKNVLAFSVDQALGIRSLLSRNSVLDWEHLPGVTWQTERQPPVSAGAALGGSLENLICAPDYRTESCETQAMIKEGPLVNRV